MDRVLDGGQEYRSVGLDEVFLVRFLGERFHRLQQTRQGLGVTLLMSVFPGREELAEGGFEHDSPLSFGFWMGRPDPRPEVGRLLIIRGRRRRADWRSEHSASIRRRGSFLRSSRRRNCIRSLLRASSSPKVSGWGSRPESRYFQVGFRCFQRFRYYQVAYCFHLSRLVATGSTAEFSSSSRVEVKTV